MNKEFKTSRPLQPNGCLTCLTNLKMRDVIQVPHLEEVGTTAQVLLKLQEGTDALMEIVDPINRILETLGEDQVTRICPIVLLVASYVRDHTWPGNARTKLLSMHSRHLWPQIQTINKIRPRGKHTRQKKLITLEWGP